MHEYPDQLQILLVEDSEMDYLVTEALLRKALPVAVDIDWASTYAEGLTKLLAKTPHVALIDYFLHDQNGVDLIREARAQGCQVPFVLLTAREDYSTDLEAMRAGADDFLIKGRLEPQMLERVLRYVVNVHRQRSEILALNQQLEQRVIERTSELIRTNYALQDSEKRMQLLKTVASVSNAADSIEGAFQNTLANISHYTGWPLGHVALVRRVGYENELRLVPSDIWYSADPARYLRVQDATRELGYFDPGSAAGQVLMTRQPQWIDFTELDVARFPRAPVALGAYLQCLLAFPVQVKGEVMAVMEFFATEPDPPSEDMLTIMQEAAQQLGYVIERKQAEEDLRRTEQHLIRAQHIARLGSMLWDVEQQTVEFSHDIAKMLQLPASRLQVQALKERVHLDDLPRFEQAVDFALQQGMPFNLDYRMFLPDGEFLYMHAQAELVQDRDGYVTQLVGVIQDVTERKRIEEVLLRMREAAELANQAKSAFLASMSHEIRTPMNAILGFTQILLRDAGATPAQRQHLGTILRSGEHLLGLINDILEMSKIEAGRMTLNPNDFDLHQLLRDVESMFSEKLAAKGLHFGIELAEDLPRYLHSDEGKLRQVLINLLSNAVKFTERGSITLRIKAQSQSTDQALLYWELEDTGVGIAAEEMHKVFSSFEQTSSGVRSQTGTGLGMSISRSYLQLMGGSLDLRSEVGQGTCFFFVLPVEIASEQALSLLAPRQRVLGLAPGQKVPRILIVDDQDNNRLLLCEMLQPLGFEVHEAINGQEAVAKHVSWRPDLILMDAAMPEMDGLAATRAIRQREQQDGDQKVAIISVSASAFEHDRASILAAGADDFLPKPVHEQALLHKLQEHLDLSYLYELLALESEASTSLHKERSWAASMLPESLRSHMLDALLSGDLDAVLEDVALLAPEQAELAAQLRGWAESYNYEQLTHFLQGA
ncbi:MAG: response regulator [Candidatus Sericytochromatia bacterium]